MSASSNLYNMDRSISSKRSNTPFQIQVSLANIGLYVLFVPMELRAIGLFPTRPRQGIRATISSQQIINILLPGHCV